MTSDEDEDQDRDRRGGPDAEIEAVASKPSETLGPPLLPPATAVIEPEPVTPA